MKLVKIAKRSGGFRTICVPSAIRKRQCREIIPHLQRIVRAVCDLDCLHGFAELRSAVTHAARHVGYPITVSLDLADFFDTVTEKQHGAKTALKRLPKEDYDRLWHDGIARQGLPTSPIVANIAAAEMDRQLLAMCKPITNGSRPIVYGRYGDNLDFSCDTEQSVAAILALVPGIVKAHGFKINEKKTHVQRASAGRRIITGVAVSETGIHPTRTLKRKLRAAIHNAETGHVKDFPKRQWTKYRKWCKFRGVDPMPKRQWLRRWLWQRVRGLQEWAQLKMPGAGKRSAIRIAETFEATDALAELACRKPVKGTNRA